jgi:hypothetical protein
MFSVFIECVITLYSTIVLQSLIFGIVLRQNLMVNVKVKLSLCLIK